ncbi:hypothetical protein [Craterilacuibacter sp.]|uniref:hypothetical protein n=1 Tax=Craterilacuibacter sp. TaxID=2870909 RepID=UPI003F3B3B42
MDMLHSTWFWCVVAAAPFVLVISTLARLARREPPPDLPPGVSPGTYRMRAGDDDDKEPRPD